MAVVLGAMQEVISQGEAESNVCITSAINPSQLTMLSYVYQKHTDVLALKKKDGLGLLFLILSSSVGLSSSFTALSFSSALLFLHLP